MTLVASFTTQAYVNHGRWVADCDRPFCGNAVQFQHRQSTFNCEGSGGCQAVNVVEWPADADAIWEALALRPVPATRNWFPTGHPLAVRSGCEMGQSPADLIEEQKEMESRGRG